MPKSALSSFFIRNLEIFTFRESNLPKCGIFVLECDTRNLPEADLHEARRGVRVRASQRPRRILVAVYTHLIL